MLTEKTGQAQSVLAGHPDIQQDQIDRPFRYHLPHRGAIFGRGDSKALLYQVFLDHLPHVGLVIDNQNVSFIAHG